MKYEVHIPSILHIGGGSRKDIGALAAKFGMKHILLVSDKFLESTGRTKEILDLLSDSGAKTALFTDISGEPEIDTVTKAMMILEKNDCDGIISVGGGSSIDTAKALSVLAANGGKMSDYMGIGKVSKPGLPHIAIPTTAGTGSEVTRVTIITDNEKNVKMMCLDNAFLPVAAIVDYEVSMSMPKNLTSFVGIDALTHAVEAYVSKKANTLSDIFAVKAIKLIGQNLLNVYHHPDDQTGRAAMMEGASYAGIAFSNASVCAVHGMSRPVGAYFHVPHGLSNAMLLPIVTEQSIAGNQARYAEIANFLNLEGQNEIELTSTLAKKLKELNKLMSIPNPAEFGIDKERYLSLRESMAEAAIDSGSPSNNPRVFTKEEIMDIYSRVYNE